MHGYHPCWSEMPVSSCQNESLCEHSDSRVETRRQTAMDTENLAWCIVEVRTDKKGNC